MRVPTARVLAPVARGLIREAVDLLAVDDGVLEARRRRRRRERRERVLAREVRERRVVAAEQVRDRLVGAVDACDGLGARDDEHLLGRVGVVLGLPERVRLVPAAHVGIDDRHEGHRLAGAATQLRDEPVHVRRHERQRIQRGARRANVCDDGARVVEVPERARQHRGRLRRCVRGARPRAARDRASARGSSHRASSRRRSGRPFRWRSARRSAPSPRSSSSRRRRRSRASPSARAQPRSRRAAR